MTQTTIRFNRNTILKGQPVQSRDLGNDLKRNQAAGSVLPVFAYSRVGKHYKILLDEPLQPIDPTAEPLTVWYVYTAHAEIETGRDEGVLLDVPFFPQTDNLVQPDRTCNSSVHAMLVEFLKPGILQPSGKAKEDDVYWRQLTDDTTKHEAHTKLLAKWGIKSVWRYDLLTTNIESQLKRGYPVPVGILHRGPQKAPTGGHVILVIGINKFGDYIFHDSYGSLLDGYQSDVQNGRAVVYPRRVFLDRWQPGGNPGWGRIVESVS